MSGQNIVNVDIHTDQRSVGDPTEVGNTGVAIHLGSLSPEQLALLSTFMADNQAAVIGSLAYPDENQPVVPQDDPDPTPPPAPAPQP